MNGEKNKIKLLYIFKGTALVKCGQVTNMSGMIFYFTSGPRTGLVGPHPVSVLSPSNVGLPLPPERVRTPDGKF